MPFLIRAHDKPDSAALRAATRPAHLDYIEPQLDRILAGGAVLDDGGAPIGSLTILDTDDRAEAERFVAEDPYVLAGLFERVDIHPWRKVVFDRQSVE